MKSMDGIVASLLAIAAGLALWAASTAVTIARPEMSVTRGPEGVVRLVGTVHWLPRSMDWRSTQLGFALEFSETPLLRIEFADGQELTWRLSR